MPDIPPPHPSQFARQKRGGAWLQTALLVFASLAVVAGVGFFFKQLFRPPQPKAAVERPAPAMASSTILAAPAAVPAQKSGKESGPQTTLARIAQMEAARQTAPGGPLYDKEKTNVALSFASLPLESPLVIEAMAALASYLSPATWRERLPFVFEPERCEPVMQELYERRGQADPEHGRLLSAGVITAGQSKVINLQFECSSRPDAGLRANFHRTRGGKLLLDWESWTAWSENAWPDLKKERSRLPVVMRALAAESSYYNYEFNESWRWLAVRLRSADGLHSVTGYAKRDSVVGIAMANLIGVPLPHKLPEGTPMPALKMPGSQALVTVRLAFPPNAESDHCVNITELIADRWLLFPGEKD